MTTRASLMLVILSRLLDTPLESLSADQPFADQGLDSLTGLRFARAVQDATGIEFDPEWLYDYPSVAELDRFLQGRGAQSGTAASAA